MRTIYNVATLFWHVTIVLHYNGAYCWKGESSFFLLIFILLYIYCSVFLGTSKLNINNDFLKLKKLETFTTK